MRCRLLAVLVSLAACASRPARPTLPSLSAAAVALAHATVVDVAAGTELADRTVVIDGDRIVAIVAGDPPAGVRTVDAHGKWIVPGLWDMHVHVIDPNAPALFVANGVTGVRVMWGNPKIAPGRVHSEMRDAIDKGALVGPRMIIASNILDGPHPIWPGSASLSTPDEGREAVADAIADGADFIKVYSGLPRDVFLAIADESKKRGIVFGGHVPESVTVAEASDAGEKSIEHLTGMSVATSAREAELIAKRGERTAENFRTAMRDEERAAAESFDDAKANALFAKLVANGTWSVPTLTVLSAIANVDRQDANDPRLKYMTAGTRQFWDPKNDFRFKDSPPEFFAAMRAGFTRKLAIVGKMNAAGAPILAGTDEGNPFCFPGFGLHDELVLLVQAGLTSAQALRAATLSPARYFNKEQTMGTVDTGKVTDLVVLDGDPLADIANTKKIFAVVARGKLYDRAALDALLRDAEQAARATVP